MSCIKLPIWLVTALVFFSSSLSAHEVRPSYLELVQLKQDSYNVMWKVPAKGDELRLGLYVKFEDDVKQISEPVDQFVGGSYVSRWRISHDKALVNTKIHIQGLESTFTEALIRIERLDGTVQVSRLMPANPSVLVQSSPTAGGVAKTYTGLGIKHIWKGIDHLLFLVCLLLISGSGKRILITITGFTLAHSVTLVLSTLNIVNLEIAPVEAIIALSIVFLATEIAKGKRDSLTWEYPVIVSASFGLLHGFGFAAVLNEIGLPNTELVTGLLFFNVGVEIGQLIFVVIVMLILKFSMYIKFDLQQALLQKSAAYCVGAIASFWLLEISAGVLL